MQRNKYFCVLLLVIFSSSAGAQEIADTAFEKTVFWRITKDGLKDTSYLFGTMHPVFKEDIHVADTVLHIFLRSSVIFFENIPTSNDDSLRIALGTMKKPKLKSLLGKICYNKLIERLTVYSDPILQDPSFDQYTPGYMNGRIMKNVFGSRLTTLDDSLVRLAQINGKKMYALDGPEVREYMADPTNLDQEANNLFAFLNDFDKNIVTYIRFMKAMSQKYLAGDIGFIFTRTNFVRINNNWTGQSFAVRNSRAETLLDERNKKWIAKIEESCATGVSFFAFGAGHLAGRKGIISLLRKKGYTVTPIFLTYK